MPLFAYGKNRFSHDVAHIAVSDKRQINKKPVPLTTRPAACTHKVNNVSREWIHSTLLLQKAVFKTAGQFVI